MVISTLIKRAFLLTGFLSIPVVFYAQETQPETPAVTTTAFGKGPMSAGIQTGTSGIGAQFTMAVAPQFNARLAGSYFSKKNYIVNSSKESVDFTNDISATTGFVGLFGDWHPFKKVSIINFTLGALYNFNKGTLDQHFTYDDGTTSVYLGRLTMDVNVNKICPYLGLTIGNPVPKKKVGVAVELGSYYLGSPSVDWKGEGLIAPTAEQADVVEENVKGYSFFPVFSLQINYKIQ